MIFVLIAFALLAVGLVLISAIREASKERQRAARLEHRAREQALERSRPPKYRSMGGRGF